MGKLRTYGYARNEIPLSERFAVFAGRRLGGKAAEHIYDNLFQQGYEGIVSGDHQINPVGAVSWSTLDRRSTPTIMGPYMVALHELAGVLQKNGYSQQEIASLLFPLTVLDNNMIEDSWNAYRPTVFANPIRGGFVELITEAPTRGRSLYRANCYVRGIGDHEIRINELPIYYDGRV